MFAEAERQFAAHCKRGGSDPIEGVDPDRLDVYRNLVMGNIYSLMSRIFPLSRAEAEDWEDLIVRFFAEHPAATPYFWRLPLEFEQWAREKVDPHVGDLLHFEVLDHELNLMADGPIPPHDPEGNLVKGVPILNPDHRLMKFTAETKFLILFRHLETLKVHSCQLSPLHVLALELIKSEPISGREAFALAADHFELEVSDEQAYSFFNTLRFEGALLGVAR